MSKLLNDLANPRPTYPCALSTPEFESPSRLFHTWDILTEQLGIIMPPIDNPSIVDLKSDIRLKGGKKLTRAQLRKVQEDMLPYLPFIQQVSYVLNNMKKPRPSLRSVLKEFPGFKKNLEMTPGSKMWHIGRDKSTNENPYGIITAYSEVWDMGQRIRVGFAFCYPGDKFDRLESKKAILRARDMEVFSDRNKFSYSVPLGVNETPAQAVARVFNARRADFPIKFQKYYLEAHKNNLYRKTAGEIQEYSHTLEA